MTLHSECTRALTTEIFFVCLSGLALPGNEAAAAAFSAQQAAGGVAAGGAAGDAGKDCQAQFVFNKKFKKKSQFLVKIVFIFLLTSREKHAFPNKVILFCNVISIVPEFGKCTRPLTFLFCYFILFY